MGQKKVERSDLKLNQLNWTDELNLLCCKNNSNNNNDYDGDNGPESIL